MTLAHEFVCPAGSLILLDFLSIRVILAAIFANLVDHNITEKIILSVRLPPATSNETNCRLTQIKLAQIMAQNVPYGPYKALSSELAE